MPRLSGAGVDLLPIVTVQINKGKLTTPPFEVIVDSGSPNCLFNGEIASLIGIADITAGPHTTTGGVAPGAELDLYEHDVRLVIGADNYRINAYFANELPVPGLLGRRGFFDQFHVTFNPDRQALELVRFHSH